TRCSCSLVSPRAGERSGPLPLDRGEPKLRIPPGRERGRRARIALARGREGACAAPPDSWAPLSAGKEDSETVEDVYVASVETDRGVKEQLRLYDTRGLQEGDELPKHYFSFADGFVLVYAMNDLESFRRVEILKKDIDKFRDKKEVVIVVLGNKSDLSEQRKVEADMAQQWAKSERMRLWEVTVTDRKTLIEPFILLASKLTQPQSKSTFPLPGRKNKSNATSEN
uniref:NFKB inhibitor interacting Ras like 1 n=1 Tax=Sarcophilus harrisii TaxID=9305 RepID=A0A7N4PIP1_SARHA